VEASRKLIRGHILGLPESMLAPTFIGTWIRDGAIVFDCANQESADWLMSLYGVIRVEDAPLHVLPANELPKHHRMVMHVEEAVLTAEETDKLFDRRNTGLVAGESS